MADWTPAASKPLTLSLVGDFADRSKQSIYLSKVTATVDVVGTGSAAPRPRSSTRRRLSGVRDHVTPLLRHGHHPGALDPAARSVTLNMTYELLVQTAPKSAQYAKQAASDTIVIALRN